MISVKPISGEIQTNSVIIVIVILTDRPVNNVIVTQENALAISEWAETNVTSAHVGSMGEPHIVIHVVNVSTIGISFWTHFKVSLTL